MWSSLTFGGYVAVKQILMHSFTRVHRQPLHFISNLATSEIENYVEILIQILGD